MATTEVTPPPLPPGFTLDQGPATSAPKLPPLPPGFTLDAAPAIPQGKEGVEEIRQPGAEPPAPAPANYPTTRISLTGKPDAIGAADAATRAAQAAPKVPTPSPGPIGSAFRQLWSDFQQGAGIMAEAAGKGVRAATRLAESAPTLPGQPNIIPTQPAGTEAEPTPTEHALGQTAKDLTELGVQSAPWLLAGEAAGAVLGSLALPAVAARALNTLVAAGWTVPAASHALSRVGPAIYALRDYGPKSEQFLNEVKDIGVSSLFAALGGLSVLHGMEATRGAFTFEEMKAFFEADPKAAAAAVRTVGAPQMEQRAAGLEPKATLKPEEAIQQFKDAYKAAGGPDVKLDIPGAVKQAFTGKKGARPAPPAEPGQLPAGAVAAGQGAEAAKPPEAPVEGPALGVEPPAEGAPPSLTERVSKEMFGKPYAELSGKQAKWVREKVNGKLGMKEEGEPAAAPAETPEGFAGVQAKDVSGLSPKEAAGLSNQDFQRWAYGKNAGVPEEWAENLEALRLRGDEQGHTALLNRAPYAEDDPQKLIQRGLEESEARTQAEANAKRNAYVQSIVALEIKPPLPASATPPLPEGFALDQPAAKAKAVEAPPGRPAAQVFANQPPTPKPGEEVEFATKVIRDEGGENIVHTAAMVPTRSGVQMANKRVEFTDPQSGKFITMPLEQVTQDNVLEELRKARAEVAKPQPGGAPSLANAVYDKLKAGESLGNVTEFNKLAEQHFGAGRASGEWTPKDAFDAMEAGVNKYLIERGADLIGKPFDEAMGELRDLMGRLTTQATRTDEQNKFQQFSTPPTESFLAAKVAGVTPQDVVLEPSAGNGGLAVWPKAIGADVHVNEVAPRRQEMLKAAGFDEVTAHDGEIINSLLDKSVKPTVVIMNPPFSSGGLKGQPGGVEARNKSQYGFNHVDSALQRLAPGGRLVTILGGGQANDPNGGATLTSGPSGKWFDRIAEKYNVRANIRISGKEYAKYGTGFATRIIVIDKDGPTPSRTTAGQLKTWNSVVQKNVNTIEEAYNALRDVADSRPHAEAPLPPRAGGAEVSRPSQPEAGVAPTPGPSRGGGGGALRGEQEARPGNELAERPGGRAGGPGELRPGAGGERVRVQQPGLPAPESVEAEPPHRPEGDIPPSVAQRPLTGTETDDAALSLGRDEDAPKSEEEDSVAYATYHPTIRGPKHPGSIVESKTMATVPLPAITYKPKLPDSVIEQGKLSAVQLEAIAIAGQQNDIILPGGFRGSALVGDGTGVGKGRIGAGILWDNYRHGRKRLVWVSEKWDLMQAAIDDFNNIGAKDLLKGITKNADGKYVVTSTSAVKGQNKYSADAKIEHEGVLFTTYPLARSENKKGARRIDQLEEYLRGNDDGEGAYILYDESHNLKNAVVGGGAMGAKPSQIGKAIKDLMLKMPKLRSASMSATAATDVMNLGYLDRLGLWGPGTPFPTGFQEFAGQIASGRLAAMEMIARELKAQGKYISRTLSFKGVKYGETEHALTEDQKEVYRTAARAWKAVVERAESTIKDTTNGGGRQAARFMSQFYSAQQRFFNLLITTLKIPTAVDLAQKALKEDKSVVITLVNTNEAAQNREKNAAKEASAEDSDEIPDYDFGPGELLSNLVREHYPTQQYVDDVDSEGNPIKVPAYTTDKDGRKIPLENPEAIRERDELLAEIKKNLNMPANPLDILVESLGGHKKVAEITGRKETYDQSTGKFVPRGDPKAKREEINLHEMRLFQTGKKRIAILSAAGGTGISLHAGNDVPNKQQRYHITLQVGWSADKQMQMFGRTHRTNQAHPPQYEMLTSDLGGEKRFVSTIAKRLGSLGAITKGQKNATSGTDLMEKVNFETDQGREATNAFYNQLLRNNPVPGTGLTGLQILEDLRVLKSESGGGRTVPPADRTNVTRLLNRLLALDPDIQNSVYGYFYDIFQAVVHDAMERGDLDTGVKTLPGDEFHVKEHRGIAKDPKTGAETFYYPVDAMVRTHRQSVRDLERRMEKHAKENPRIMVGKNGNLMLVIDAKPIVHANGSAEDAVYVSTPEKGRFEKKGLWKLEYGTEEVGKKAQEALEAAQNALEDARRTVEYRQNGLERYQGTSNEQYARESLQRARDAVVTKEAELKKAEDDAADPIGAAKEQWQKEYDEAPSHLTEEHHLIGGAVMRYWNPIKEASGFGNIYTTTDAKTGQRVVGVDIPAGEIRGLLDRITGGASTVNASQLATDVVRNNLTYSLEGGIEVRRGNVGREKVVRLFPPNENVARALKDLGVMYERGVQPLYYVPNVKDRGPNEKILGEILKEYPVKAETPEAEPEALRIADLREGDVLENVSEGSDPRSLRGVRLRVGRVNYGSRKAEGVTTKHDIPMTVTDDDLSDWRKVEAEEPEGEEPEAPKHWKIGQEVTFTTAEGKQLYGKIVTFRGPRAEPARKDWVVVNSENPFRSTEVRWNDPTLRAAEPSGGSGERFTPGTPTVKQPSDVAKLSALRTYTEAVGAQAKAAGGAATTRAKLADKLADAKDAVSRAMQAVVDSGKQLRDWYTQPELWTDFKEALGKYSFALQKDSIEVRRWAEAIKRAVPNKLRRQAITNWVEAHGDKDILRERAAASRPGSIRRGYQLAMELTPEELNIANNITMYHDAALEEAIEAGFLEQGVEDYMHHIWKKPNPVTRALMAEIQIGKMQTNPAFAKKRVFDTYFAGEQLGYIPRDKDVGYLVAVRDSSFKRAMAARAFIKDLLDGSAVDGRPIAAVSGGGKQIQDPGEEGKAYLIRPRTKPEETGDYRPIDHPAMRRWKWVTKDTEGNPVFIQGDMLIHPDHYQHVKNLLTTSALRRYALGRGVLAVSGGLKHTLLSLSMFHQVQEGIHGVFHGVDPFDVPDVDLDKPGQMALVKHGLVVAPEFGGLEKFSEGVQSAGLLKLVPGLGPILQRYEDYLFADYIPRLKMQMATDALERNRKRYPQLSEDQLLELTANQGNAAFGALNYTMMGRNPTLQDVFRLMALAPDFLEARARFTAQAAGRFGKEQFMALVIRGALGMYIIARILNQLLDGDPHWGEPFGVIYHGRNFRLRTLPGDIFHLINDPRSFVYWRLNPMTLKPAIEAVTGRDVYGRKQTFAHQVQDYFRGFEPLPIQGFDKGQRKKLWESVLTSIGVSTNKPEQKRVGAY